MKHALVLTILLLTVSLQAAQAEPPSTSPRPLKRAGAETAAPVATVNPAAAATIAVAAVASRPRLRPAAAAEALAAPLAAPLATPVAAIAAGPGLALSPRPVRRPANGRPASSTELYQIVSAAVRTQPVPEAIIGRQGSGLCGVPGIEGQSIAPINSNVRGCGVAEPVRITSVDGVRLSQAAIMDCPTARALNTWVQRGVKPAVGRTGGGVVQLQVAGHYVCRSQNNRRGAPISEHGRGKAIDISGLRLANGETVSILRGWKDQRYSSMLRQMHRAGCGIFGTTLGPGSDGHHEDHLHYDTASHRNGAYCR
ncbi:extensin family protein [Plastorhodobacter daqingensis]|uniref:Extensin family protein n=1 Tax=Plastorhodobacter daqingensis TaxID=1387281 RepID=A0ABW2UPD1_9RHOB